jgi:putative sigma-54 modulation protein
VNLILRGRGIDLNDRLREYASEKLTRSQRFFERIIKMEVELSEERNPRVKARHRVEVTVKTPGETLRAHGEGTDYFAAIDTAADRLESQVKKFKGRLVNRGHRGNNHLESPMAGGSDPEDGPVIVRQRQVETKPMTPEEAVLELEQGSLQFLLFVNAETMAPGVLYRRPDGSYGLVETQG